MSVASDYAVDCLGCHIRAKYNDWGYLEAYLMRDELAREVSALTFFRRRRLPVSVETSRAKRR